MYYQNTSQSSSGILVLHVNVGTHPTQPLVHNSHTLQNVMAGHSKWANIKHRKAATDAKRGKLFTRVSKEIIVAARLGGGDPDANSRLRMAIQNARGVSMPADNIKRAIQRGTGEIEGVTYEDVVYEGYGPGGVALIVECTTENRNRTVQEVRATFSKYGGSLGENNSVSWNFTRMGEIRLQTTSSEEKVLEDAINAGASDVEYFADAESGQGAVVYCAIDSLQAIMAIMESNGHIVVEQRLAYLPTTLVQVNDGESEKKLRKLLDTFDDNDDVQQVFHNAELEEESE